MRVNDSIDRVHALLLALLSPIATVAQSHFDEVIQADGERFLKLARQHRLLPMLHWQISKVHSHLELPAEFSKILKNGFDQSTIRSLQLKRELHLVNRLLKEAGIPCIFLKGAFLAWEAYPHPALRPMRDLDILVPFDRAKEAWLVLLQAGFVGARCQLNDMSFLDIEATAQHFPPIMHPGRKVSVELHYSLFPEYGRHANQKDLSDYSDFWSRANHYQDAEEALCFESPTDLLLHLIIHAVNHHLFDNGPLIVSDVGFLLENDKIDWSLFWEMARSYDVEKSCFLIFELVTHYWGKSLTEQLAERVDNLPLNTAIELMLIDHDIKGSSIAMAQLAKAKTLNKKLSFAVRKLFPNQNFIARMYSVEKRSGLFYFWYLVNAYRLLVTRLYPIIKFERSSDSAVTADAVKTLSRWLKP